MMIKVETIGKSRKRKLIIYLKKVEYLLCQKGEHKIHDIEYRWEEDENQKLTTMILH